MNTAKPRSARTKILWTTIETTTTPVIHVARASKTRRCVRSDFTNAMGPYCPIDPRYGVRRVTDRQLWQRHVVDVPADALS